MDQTMRVLALVALLLYLAPRVFAGQVSEGQRIWMWRAAAGAIAIGVAIALIEAAQWFLR